ncbi:hypothetical protein EPI10_030743 [Gossypium australe]|uniref:Uncharacterized protein n=1 Tax=Gossypium australe TaxID=47621 RepID=A0A5B6X1B4_9ROSI|nr:hypothetical protein EPI10_030743 [Gossypium australe]
MMEDSNQHLKRFVTLLNIIGSRMILFLFSSPFLLIDNACSWLDLQELGSITTWEKLSRKFLQGFSPIS